MALLPIYHVVADMYRTNPAWAGTAIKAGTFMKLAVANGVTYATPCDTLGEVSLGVAGDTEATTGSAAGGNGLGTGGGTTVYADSVIINGVGGGRVTQNRVSDFYDETLASGRVTVYNSGGNFATDMYADNVITSASSILAPLYVTTTGRLSTTSGGANAVVARLTGLPGALESGVPGVDVNASLSLGNFITFKLLV